MKKFLVFATLIGAILLLLSACSDSSYYLQAIRGQYDLLSRRQQIKELLASDTLPPKQRRELSRILQIRDFASQRLGLPDNDSYRSFVRLDRPYPLWNVVAAPELSLRPLTWCFPIAGCVSYRGYFAKVDASRFAATLRHQGYDTLVSGVPAYSTLTWFDDPVLSSFSSWPEPSVARLIFHELAHQQLYLEGDSDFNEAFATSVELAGTRLWLAEHGSVEQRALFNHQLKRENDFVAWSSALHAQLQTLYSSTLPDDEKRREKQEIFAAARNDYQRLKAGWGNYSGYDRWVATLNNARLVSLQTYRRLLPAFNALFTKTGRDFHAFYRACHELADLPAAQRQQRLAELQQSSQLAVRKQP